jgi:hypothetical protein
VDLELTWLLLHTAKVVNDPGHSEADQANDCQIIIQILKDPKILASVDCTTLSSDWKLKCSYKKSKATLRVPQSHTEHVLFRKGHVVFAKLLETS